MQFLFDLFMKFLIKQGYIELHNGKLDNIVVCKDCHALKDEEMKGDWITEDAKIIMVSVHITNAFQLKITHF